MKHYDVIWIGTGQAAGSILPRLSAAGKAVALVKILVDADTEECLGATILGVGGDEVHLVFSLLMIMILALQLWYFSRKHWF